MPGSLFILVLFLGKAILIFHEALLSHCKLPDQAFTNLAVYHRHPTSCHRVTP